MSESPVIQLLRHGETEAGAAFIGSSDVTLTATGWQQMREAVIKAKTQWDVIISSPLKRCADFARHLADERGIPLIHEPRWRELDFGAWEGRTAIDLMQSDATALQQLWNEPEHFTAPQGEAVAVFRQRVLSAWQTCYEHDAVSILVITHAGVIRVLLSSLYPDDYPSMMQMNVAHGSLHKLAQRDLPMTVP